MLEKIIYSNWFAWLVLSLAGMSLVLLYLKGRTTESTIGAGVLAVAALLIFLGRKPD
jgi:hypothetical protein